MKIIAEQLSTPEPVSIPSDARPGIATEIPDHADLDGRNEIAIIGMAGRFPGAQNIAEFWELLMNGRSGIHTFSTNELAAINTSIEKDGIYVPRRGSLKNVEMFDNKLWRLTELEAAAIDPQVRRCIYSRRVP